MAVTELVRVVITVADLDAVLSFYRDGLGLDVGPAQAESDPAWMVLLGLDAGTTARVAVVHFGAEMLLLAAFDPPGAPYPVPCASNDEWFQHVALVAGDIEAVWNRLEQAKPEAITEGPPVLLLHGQPEEFFHHDIPFFIDLVDIFRRDRVAGRVDPPPLVVFNRH